MVDDVDGLVDLDRLRHVVVEEREGVAAQVRDVVERARQQIVDADHPVADGDEVVAEMRPEESRPTGDDGGRHLADASGGLGGRYGT